MAHTIYMVQHLQHHTCSCSLTELEGATGVGSREQGAVSGEQEQGAGSREQGVGNSPEGDGGQTARKGHRAQRAE